MNKPHLIAAWLLEDFSTFTDDAGRNINLHPQPWHRPKMCAQRCQRCGKGTCASIHANAADAQHLCFRCDMDQ